MKHITTQSNNFVTKDRFNIKAGAKALKEAVGEKLEVTKACIGEDTDKDGNPVKAGAIITDKGAYTTISATAVDLIADLIDMIDEGEEKLIVMVESRKSNNDRDYLVLSIE